MYGNKQMSDLVASNNSSTRKKDVFAKSEKTFFFGILIVLHSFFWKLLITHQSQI